MSRAPLVSCLLTAVTLLLVGAPHARAGLTQLDQFDPGLGQLVGLAYDHVSDTVWVYGASDPDLRQYATDGTFLGGVPRPGESSNDCDLEIAPEALSLAGTPVPAGTLLFINGETGPAEIYAVDKTTGAVLATLPTAFGISHVVGGAYHPGRKTFFLVQDRVASGTVNDSLVAEVDATTGAVLGSFKVDVVLPGFTVNFGDIEVSTATGNLLVASSDETSLAEFTPAGVFVQQLPLPATADDLSGIGLVDGAGDIWGSITGGDVLHISGFTWANLGQGLAGIAGTPSLTGSGTLVAGSSGALTVAGAKPLAGATLVVGLTQLGLPFKGGTLVPAPNVLVGGLFTDGAGAFTLPFVWPVGVPAGFASYYQLWVSDAAGPKGFAATNGLRSVTP